MSTEVEKAEQRLNVATAALKKPKTSQTGGSRDETNYAAAYKALYSLGVRPRLKSKYRATLEYKKVRG